MLAEAILRRKGCSCRDCGRAEQYEQILHFHFHLVNCAVVYQVTATVSFVPESRLFSQAKPMT